MKIEKLENHQDLGKRAGQIGAEAIRQAIRKQGYANIILATGQSQFETIQELVRAEDLDWSKVRMFHLDEYIGLPVTHLASFRKYLTERFVNHVPALAEVVLIDGEVVPVEEECQRLARKILDNPIDVAFVGIGENGHLAFNDPPADFEETSPYIVVNLDKQCRQQQLGEGWFPSLDDVPLQAISMSIRQIMKSKKIICAVPDSRKAQAVKNCLSGEVSNMHPASILQQHPDCTCFVDSGSGALLP